MGNIVIPVNDEHVFEQIKQNNEQAFSCLFEKFYSPLCKYIYTYTKDEVESENLVQEVFINIWNKRDKVNIKTSVSSYLYRSVKNSAINFLTKNARNRTESLEDIGELEIGNEDSEIDENEFLEMEKKFSEALASLPTKCKNIFIMSRVENLKYREIAKKLDISIKTVETQMSIAIKKLKEHCMA
jgi:RNA polymerase sigma-70 factor, ECF subfamily